MKTFLTLFVLLFSSSVVADDISDFKIEGIGIDDNIFEFFTEQQIQKNREIYHNDNSFITLEFIDLSFLKTYEALQLAYKSKDNTIHEIVGIIPYKYNIENCFEKMDSITSNILNSITIISKSDKVTQKLKQDSSGKSEMTIVELYFESGKCQIGCYNWSDEKGWIDHLRVSLRTNEFKKWSEENLITTN